MHSFPEEELNLFGAWDSPLPIDTRMVNALDAIPLKRPFISYEIVPEQRMPGSTAQAFCLCLFSTCRFKLGSVVTLLGTPYCLPPILLGALIFRFFVGSYGLLETTASLTTILGPNRVLSTLL